MSHDRGVARVVFWDLKSRIGSKKKTLPREEERGKLDLIYFRRKREKRGPLTFAGQFCAQQTVKNRIATRLTKQSLL